MKKKNPSVARYKIMTKPYPSVLETIRFGELARKGLQAIYGRLHNNHSSVIFSGKNLNGDPIKGHQHAFFLPTDEDGDGGLDHLTIISQIPFGDEELSTIHRFQKLVGENRIVNHTLELMACGPDNTVSDIPILSTSDKWRSTTPFVPVRHYKRRGQKRDTCDPQDFPAVVLQEESDRRCFPALEEIRRVHGYELRDQSENTGHDLNTNLSWAKFQRHRASGSGKRGLHPGCGFEIAFSLPVQGPIAFGYGCHYGLGLFAPI